MQPDLAKQRGVDQEEVMLVAESNPTNEAAHGQAMGKATDSNSVRRTIHQLKSKIAILDEGAVLNPERQVLVCTHSHPSTF